MDSEVRRIFFVQGKRKKAQWVSKPLYPTYKKFSASIHDESSYCDVATPYPTIVDLHVCSHSLTTPDALDRKEAIENLKLCD